jgi:3-methylfumaryl-CoA hydratase
MNDKPDLNHLRQWIGRSTQASDVVTAQLTKGLRATLFMDIGEPKPGDAAPFTIHWCLGQPVYPMSELGPDGHPTRGGFLPPVPLPRRMWAGGELEFLEPLRVGDEVTRTSGITDVTMKTGSTGVLCFVSVDHLITTARGAALRERQDIVYRDMSTAKPSAPAKSAAPKPVAKHRRFASPRRRPAAVPRTPTRRPPTCGAATAPVEGIRHAWGGRRARVRTSDKPVARGTSGL